MAGKREFSREERRKWIEGLRLIDDHLMRVILSSAPSEDGEPGDVDRTTGEEGWPESAGASGDGVASALECVQVIVRAALGRDDIMVVSSETQADMKSLAGHSSILDVRAEDGEGNLYDIEVESASPPPFTPRRGRFHAAMLDSSALPEGADYEELPDAYVIVISEEDLLGNGRLLTTVRRTRDDGAPYADGSAILYVNCSAPDDTPLGRVAHDFLCENPADMLVPELAGRMGLFKRNGNEEDDMRKQGWPYSSSNEMEQRLIDRNYYSGHEDGLEEGLEQGLEQGRGATRAMGERLRELGVDQSVIDDALAVGQAALA